MSPNLILLVPSHEEGIRTQTHIERESCEDTGKRQLSTSQGEKSQKSH